eukprot:m.1401800 g.1401800  ORF g.1401800 m.1401800 type:complete len:103 (+) comp25009_c0_seq7:881-1189(+)
MGHAKPNVPACEATLLCHVAAQEPMWYATRRHPPAPPLAKPCPAALRPCLVLGLSHASCNTGCTPDSILMVRHHTHQTGKRAMHPIIIAFVCSFLDEKRDSC